MKRKFIYSILLLLVCCVSALSAQNISVSSFRLLENDLAANTTGTMERDQNGEISALIKVVTTEQGFVFDGGMTGIVKTRQEIGEVWVYVPHGIKKITIKHPQLGVLRDYWFPVSIEKARTYEMVLSTGKVETIVTRTAEKQYVVFQVEPASAVVELDDLPLEVDSEGYAEKSVPYGTYNYRVSCANYHTEAGQVTVNAQGKAEVKVTLRPNFGWIKFEGAEELRGAHIYINNERIGQLPVKSGAIKSGTHKVKVLKPLYKPYEQQVVVNDGDVTTLKVEMAPNFANITLKTDEESEIWVDGKLRGKGLCVVGLEIGDYTVEVKRESHRTVSEVLHVVDITARTVQLPSPKPMLGILDITSTPSRATVYIDGVKMGETPLMKDDVLAGARKITFKKEGYETLVKTVEVKENTSNTVSGTLVELAPEPVVQAVVKPVVQGNRHTYTVNGVAFTMMAIDGGSFTMGATSEQAISGRDGEKPAHQVTLSSYAIGETEVTQGLWQAVMGSNPAHYQGNLKCPVEYVSWNECQTFITRLNTMTSARFRLPTEAEWEYAARGGNAGKGYRYSGSNTATDVAWCISNSAMTTHPVKTKLPNELGIYNMSGNVSEWCANGYYNYPSSPQVNPKGEADGDNRVFRGGSWSDDAGVCRVAIRNAADPRHKASNRGLRLALTLDAGADAGRENRQEGLHANDEDAETFDVVECPPEFPGGMAELMKWIKNNVRYPKNCMEQGIQGRVIVQFVVNADGSIAEPRVIKPVHPDLDAEAIRVISAMPKWKPGEQRGNKVRTRFTLPVAFRF